jgi:hypothetical protein
MGSGEGYGVRKIARTIERLKKKDIYLYI